MANLLILCTGNAARSVMAGAAIAQRSTGHTVVTAGTLTTDGRPMSWRTRAAIESMGLEIPEHLSLQVGSRHLAPADLVIGLAPEHVEWVRRNHPVHAHKTATLIHLVASLPPGPTPLAERVSALTCADHVLTADEEVDDPGGKELPEFLACASVISRLVDDLLPRL